MNPRIVLLGGEVTDEAVQKMLEEAYKITKSWT